jgi:hypothetical protein
VRTIVKIQRPLDGPGGLLVYDNERTFMAIVPPAPELLALFGPEDLKVYVEADVDLGVLRKVAPIGLLSNARRVDDLAW